MVALPNEEDIRTRVLIAQDMERTGEGGLLDSDQGSNGVARSLLRTHPQELALQIEALCLFLIVCKNAYNK